MRQTKSARGIVVMCNLEGAVTAIVRDTLGLAPVLEICQPLSSVSTNPQRVHHFFEKLRVEGVAFGKELPLRLKGREISALFSGVTLPEGVLVTGTALHADSPKLVRDLLEMNNEQANMLRMVHKQNTLQSRLQTPQDESALEEISRVNNELANAQRELALKNAALSRTNSALHEAQTKLQQANATLEQRVQARTLELVHAKEVAEAANNVTSQLLSRASHELRTPLNAIMGFSQVLQRQNLQPRQQLMVDEIHRGGNNLLALVNDILEINQLQSDPDDTNYTSVSVREIVAQALEPILPLANSAGVTTVVEIPEEPTLQVLANADYLKHALGHLLSNAVKFNSAGGKIILSCTKVRQGILRIDVQDTGVGIAPADLLKLFTPFERLHAEALGVQGSGLGLLKAKRLIETMRGKMFVKSTSGKGSTFSIELPQYQ